MQNSTRDTLIIGHANPEDNEFTLWLSSRLMNEGYDVYSDLNNLLGGEQDFWELIQKTIRHKAAKYVLVLSHNTFSKKGVKDEWEYARSIQNEFNLTDFIIPLRIDDVSFNERIGLNRINIIDCSSDLRNGFNQLLKKLDYDKVPKTASQTSIQKLLENSVNIYQSLTGKKEIYYSNLLPITQLPENIYVFKFHHKNGAEAVRNECNDFPVSVMGNLLCSFEENIPYVLTKRDYIEVRPQDKLILNIQDILTNKNPEPRFEIGNPLNILKVLLRNAFRNFMFNKGLLKYELANKKFCYYYKTGTIEGDKVTYNYQGKKKTKNLIGTYSTKSLNPLGEYETIEHYWHFGITSKVLTSPFLSFGVKTHMLFSDNGETIWDSDRKLHSARRDKCRMWHNAAWREIYLAYLHSLEEQNESFYIPLTKTFKLEMSCQPFILESSVGYIEPADFERMFMLRDEKEVEEEILEENEVESDE